MDERTRLEREYYQYSTKLRTDGFDEALADAMFAVEKRLRELGGDPRAIAKRVERETRQDN